ncbi:MAG: TerC family protein, partial [Burkholderiaceae bacterium]|nr:TerC family protein [Burkholderiaceae bacterium]
TGGTMMVGDPALAAWVPTQAGDQPGTPNHVLPLWHYGCGVLGALLVLALGKWLAARQSAPASAG